MYSKLKGGKDSMLWYSRQTMRRERVCVENCHVCVCHRRLLNLYSSSPSAHTAENGPQKQPFTKCAPLIQQEESVSK